MGLEAALILALAVDIGRLTDKNVGFFRSNTASRPTSPGAGWLASVRILGLFPPRQPLKSDKETLKATDLRPEPRGRGSGHSFGSWNGLRASVDRPLPCISARIGPVPLYRSRGMDQAGSRSGLNPPHMGSTKIRGVNRDALTGEGTA